MNLFFEVFNRFFLRPGTPLCEEFWWNFKFSPVHFYVKYKTFELFKINKIFSFIIWSIEFNLLFFWRKFKSISETCKPILTPHTEIKYLLWLILIESFDSISFVCLENVERLLTSDRINWRKFIHLFHAVSWLSILFNQNESTKNCVFTTWHYFHDWNENTQIFQYN